MTSIAACQLEGILDIYVYLSLLHNPGGKGKCFSVQNFTCCLQKPLFKVVI